MSFKTLSSSSSSSSTAATVRQLFRKWMRAVDSTYGHENIDYVHIYQFRKLCRERFDVHENETRPEIIKDLVANGHRDLKTWHELLQISPDILSVLFERTLRPRDSRLFRGWSTSTKTP